MTRLEVAEARAHKAGFNGAAASWLRMTLPFEVVTYRVGNASMGPQPAGCG